MSELTLKLKYDRMYSNIVATGEYAWAPSSGVQGDEDESGDSEEDINPASNNDITSKSGKREEKEANEGQAKKKKMVSLAFNYSQSGTNYLTICRRGVIQLLCIWIAKDVNFYSNEGGEKCGLLWEVLKKNENGASTLMEVVDDGGTDDGNNDNNDDDSTNDDGDTNNET
uniref:Uncharacterized protein n=1 Tax=Salix viminalis TaxID=40686 RepID=A0A6N2NBK5_SALVM